MLSLLNNMTTRFKGYVRFPEWNYIRDGLRFNLKQTVEYYRSGAYAVESSHELVKLLFGLATSTDYDLNQYYRIVDAKALTVAQQLGFTTSFSKGRIFNNVFFAGGSKEVIIVTDEPFDAAEATRNWRDLRPIRVLRHGFDQIDAFPLNGTVKSSEISVFSINLSMLAVQYRAYRQWQKTYVTEETGRNSVYHFCRAYPINNMLYESMDQAVFNRIVRLRKGLETSDNQYQHPFHFTNYVLKVDRILEMVLKYMETAKGDLVTSMLTVPLIDLNNARELMRLPDIPQTRQINWAIFLARIEMLLFFLSYTNMVKKTDQSFLNKLKYELSTYLKDGTIQSAMPAELYDRQKMVIQQLLNEF